MKYNATRLIANAFVEDKIKFRVTEHSGGPEDIEVGFAIESGPAVRVRFVSASDRNDVSLRVFGLINSVNKERKARILEACNELNNTFRFLKFVLDNDMDVNIEYDFPRASSDDSIGAMCVEVFRRLMDILDEAYPLLMKAMYTEDEVKLSRHQPEGQRELSRLDKALQHLLSENGVKLSGNESTVELLEKYRALRNGSQAVEDDGSADEADSESDDE